MNIKFIKMVWDKLVEESNKTGQSIPAIVNRIVCEHYNLNK